MADDDENKGGDGGNKGGTPPEKKPEVSFPTRGEFHAEIDRKLKPAVAKAVEETSRKYLEALGIESEEELTSVVETVKKGKAAVTETDQLKQQHTKLTKQHAALQEQFNAAMSWKHRAIKQSALSAYSSKTVDLETLAALVEPKIQIGEDDVATGPNGKALEDVIEEIFKAKPFLKVPDNSAGAGTKPGGGKSTANGKQTKADDESDKGETPRNGFAKPELRQAVVAAFMAQEKNGGTGP